MEPIVTTPFGKIGGKKTGSHFEFLGIRYAVPPVGERRYSEPQPIGRWKNLYDATQYAAMAPQVWQDDPPINLVESEDCLFLNIYSPGLDDKKRPVMFYIHGGAYAIGSGSRPRLYGGNLAERGDVVVVTIQYRLGPLGFLYMEGIPSNLGLKDQICALEWVKKNISAFGGDPDNITIFGQSAGSISVSYLLVMPEAEGLFHNAIAQSATFPIRPSSVENSTRITRMFLSNLGLEYGDVAALKNLEWEDIIQAQKKISKDILSDKHHGPVLEGVSIPTNPLVELREGFGSKIPLLIGHTADEFPIFEGFLKSRNLVIKQLAKRMISKHFLNLGLSKENQIKMLAFYKTNLPEDAIRYKEYDELVTDLGFRIPSMIVADAHCSSKSKTFYYEFNYKAPKIGAAVHVLDLFFIFGTMETTDISEAMKLNNSAEEIRLSHLMMDAWTSCARSGDPNHTDLPEWREYNSETRPVMILDTKPKLVTNHLSHRLEFWKSISLL